MEETFAACIGFRGIMGAPTVQNRTGVDAAMAAS